MKPDPWTNLITMGHLVGVIRVRGREPVERLAQVLGHPRPHMLSLLTLVKWVQDAAQRDRERGYAERTKRAA